MMLAAAVLAGLLALIFSALGTAKILALKPMRALAAEVGFSIAAYRRIGVLEVAAAVGLLTGLIEPVIGALAGVGLLLLLGGAVVAHVRKGQGPQKFAAAVVVGFLVAAYLVIRLWATR